MGTISSCTPVTGGQPVIRCPHKTGMWFDSFFASFKLIRANNDFMSVLRDILQYLQENWPHFVYNPGLVSMVVGNQTNTKALDKIAGDESIRKNKQTNNKNLSRKLAVSKYVDLYTLFNLWKNHMCLRINWLSNALTMSSCWQCLTAQQSEHYHQEYTDTAFLHRLGQV